MGKKSPKVAKKGQKSWRKCQKWNQKMPQKERKM